MENQQKEMSQIKNLLGEVNNHIIQINDKIMQINNIITQINTIMLNNNNKINQKNTEKIKIDNFMNMMNNFKIKINDYDLSSGKNNEEKLFPMKKVEELSGEGLDKEAIETVMNETKCSREVAIKALRKHNGDPVEALLEVDNNDKQINKSIKKEGELKEEDLEKENIEFIMNEGKVSREIAIKTLIKHKGDPVSALLEISQ